MTDILAGYLARIRAEFPALEIDAARLNRDGMINDVVIVNETWVYRFARNEQARALLAYEAMLLDVIGRAVVTAVPRVERTAADFIVYRYVPGVPLYRHALLRAAPALQEAVAQQLAAFLRQLHAIPLSVVPAAPWAATTPPSSRREQYARQLAALEKEVFPLLWADQKAWIADLFAPVLDGRVDLDAFAPALIHRDLAAYHILHDPQAGRLLGVIDYGTAGEGDVAVDWGCLINTYGETFVRSMHRAYPISQATMDRARFFAGALELEWALHGIQTNDPSLLLVHLGRARDSLPLLTPWP